MRDRGEMRQPARALFIWASHQQMAPYSNYFSLRAIAAFTRPLTPVL